ncbi:hypothetical protein CDD80_355 [Ophiocordyceps camponoti-rufipedis]|uniref:Uncharacterized protein n=1 Tax=Ophiocordyceps camponoti-rufipedis TaxID=2004952 RepID=A0A2C5ZFF8_9HYPO|nr:hypothetical protein CDD80_355 [Ophiocordyceps camponoti-rufipedis]
MTPETSNDSAIETMAPKLSEDEIDDIIYFSRTGETTTLLETLSTLSSREKTSPTQILNATRDESSSTPLHMSSANGHLGTFPPPSSPSTLKRRRDNARDPGAGTGRRCGQRAWQHGSSLGGAGWTSPRCAASGREWCFGGGSE